MMKDLPKYHQTGLFSPDATEKWNSLLSTFTLVYGNLPSPEPSWILTNFKPVSQRNLDSSCTPVISDQIIKKSQATKQIRKVTNT